MFRRSNAVGYAGPWGGARPSTGIAVVSLALAALLTMAGSASAQSCPKRCLTGDPNGFEPNDQGKLCAVDTDCNLCNPASPDYEPDDCAAAVFQGGMCQARSSCVHLEWRPSVIGASGPGQIVNLNLYAKSSTTFNQEFESIEAILDWDQTKLKLLGKTDPCTVVDACTQACPANTYRWFSSTFPNDCVGGDGLNAPCPGDPANDGDAFYIALSRICCTDPNGPPGNCDLPAANPVATPTGLFVTSFRFQVLSAVGTSSNVVLPFDAGGDARTRVIGGSNGAEVVTGNVGNAIIVVQECTPPVVRAVGSRVIEIDPGSGTAAVGFRVTSDSPGLTCMDRYAGTTGALGPPASAAFKTPAQWGSALRLRGRRIIPEATYKIQKDCGSVGAPSLTTPVLVTTKMWSDTDQSLVIDFKDIARLVSAFQGAYNGQDPPLYFADADLLGDSGSQLCTPNNDINFLDIAAGVQAFVRFGAPGANAFHEIPCDISFCAGQ